MTIASKSAVDKVKVDPKDSPEGAAGDGATVEGLFSILATAAVGA